MVVAVNKFITLNNEAAATVVWSQHRHSSHGNFLNWPRPQSPLLGHNMHRARIYLTNCFRRLFPATGCHRNCWGARGNGPGQKVKLFLDLELGFWSTSSLTFCRLLLLARNACGPISHCRQQSVVWFMSCPRCYCWYSN